MSYQGAYGGSQDHPALPSTNPWASEQGQNQYSQAQQQNLQQSQPQQNPWQQSQPQQNQYSSQGQEEPLISFDAPPGPPPRRTDTFNETSFVPESERGEQREAMEQFEMSRSKPESQTDRDVATLQQEFPSVDGSLIAALYADGGMGAAREMLVEIDAQAKQQQ